MWLKIFKEFHNFQQKKNKVPFQKIFPIFYIIVEFETKMWRNNKIIKIKKLI